MKRIGLLALVGLFLVAGVANAEFDVKPVGEVFFHWAYNLTPYDEDWDPRYGGGTHPAGNPPMYGAYDTDYNEFATDRIYLGARARITDSLSAKIVFNAFMHDGEWLVHPEFAWGNYKIMDAVNLRAGLFGTSWIKFDNWAYDYRYVLKAPYELWFQETETDLGVAILGKFPGGYGSYQGGIYNGEGNMTPEANAGKSADVRVTFAPIQVVDATKLLSFNVFLRYEKEDPDRETTDLDIAAMLHWRWKITDDLRINLGVEFDYSTFQLDRYHTDDEEIVNSTVLSAFADFKFYGAGVFIRYDSFDPNTENFEGDADDADPTNDDPIGYRDEQWLLAAGISYDFHRYVSFALSYQHWAYTLEWIDDNDDDVVLPADQYFMAHWKVEF